MSEFPEELIKRCSKVIHEEWLRGRSMSAESQAIAVLRESGHAELVAALKKALPHVSVSSMPRAIEVETQGQDALRKAGAA